MTINLSVHPYWSSLRASDDPYWRRINGLASGALSVPAIRLDDLAHELDLKPPYLLKLEIQGAEVQALRGAREILGKTHVVICEADLDDFQAINAELTSAGFRLHDLTQLSYAHDQSLGWFYPVYVNRSLAHVAPGAFWREANNESVIREQIERRKNILARLNEELRRIKASRGRS